MGAAQDNKSIVTMDARKFVRHINNGAAAKLSFFEDAVKRMGTQANKKLRLTSLDSTSLMFEDVDQNQFFIADIKKAAHGKIELDNVRQIQIVEEEKSNHFQKNCLDLVESVVSDDLKNADRIFGKIEGQRYNSKVIPESGYITPKDGCTRHVNVSSRIVKEDHAENIVRLFTESVKDSVELERGKIVRGTLSDGTNNFVIPINEYTRRRLIAHKMKNVAESAYKSNSFQNLVVEIASLVCEGNVRGACQLAAKFLREEQEFCLLNSKSAMALVENALAATGEFNHFLAKDVAKVFHKTNLKVNRDSIVESWLKTAQKAENSALMNNATILSESQEFESDYDNFLNLVFNEEMDIQQARAKAYRTTLKIIAGVLPEMDEEEGSGSASIDELDELIERLSGTEPDTDAVLQAEELLASISDSLIDSIQNLEGFDHEPGESKGEEGEAGAGEEAEDDGELVPLPEVGEDEEAEEGEEGPPGLDAPPPAIGGEEEEKEEDAGEMPPLPESSRPGTSSKLSVAGLLEHAENWRINGEAYLAKEGYEKCAGVLNSFVKRCMDIGPTANLIRESFESMRQKLVDTNGRQLFEEMELEDAYNNSVTVALNGPARLGSSKDPENDPDFVGRTVKVESRINRDYCPTVLEAEQPYGSALVPSGLSAAKEPLRMDELQGKGGIATKGTTKSDGKGTGGSAAGYDQKQRGTGVQAKGVKPSDGRKGLSSNSGAVAGSTRMDDLQGKGGVQAKSVGSSDGRSGTSTAKVSAESAVAAKGGSPKTDLSMGSDFQGKSGKGSVTGKKLGTGDGSKSNTGGTLKGGLKGVDQRMDDLQGKGGVADSSPTGEHPGSDDTELKPASRGGDMAKTQGKGGVAEEFLSPNQIADLIAEMEEAEESTKLTCMKCKIAGKDKCECEPDAEPASEAQIKGPSRKGSGLKRTSISPMEGKNSNGPVLVEDDLPPMAPESDAGDGLDMGMDMDAGLDDMPAPEDASLDLNLSDDDIVVIAGKPGKVLDKLQDALADLDSEEMAPELEGGDMMGGEAPTPPPPPGASEESDDSAEDDLDKALDKDEDEGEEKKEPKESEESDSE